MDESCMNHSILGCPGKEVRINGDRIDGLLHLLIDGVYWEYNPTY